MEIYPGLKVNDELTLGDMRAIKKAFGRELHELDWSKLDPEMTVTFLSALVQSASPVVISDLEFKVGKIPFAKMTDALNRIPWMTTSNTDATKAKSGNLKEQASKKPTNG